jgi:hypothetical protein
MSAEMALRSRRHDQTSLYDDLIVQILVPLVDPASVIEHLDKDDFLAKIDIDKRAIISDAQLVAVAFVVLEGPEWILFQTQNPLSYAVREMSVAFLEKFLDVWVELDGERHVRSTYCDRGVWRASRSAFFAFELSS